MVSANCAHTLLIRSQKLQLYFLAFGMKCVMHVQTFLDCNQCCVEQGVDE